MSEKNQKEVKLVSKEEKIKQEIKNILKDIEGLDYGGYGKLDMLKRRLKMLLEQLFSPEYRNIKEIDEISFPKPPTSSILSDFEYDDLVERWETGKEFMINLINSSLEEYKYKKEEPILEDLSDFWILINPQIVKVSKPRFNPKIPETMSDSVEAAFKEVNDRVKQYCIAKKSKERDGSPLMKHAFSLNNPIIVIDDLDTETGRNRQLGYMEIFSGSMMAIRNPKAHRNIIIDEKRAIHFLFLASLLMCVLDEAGVS